MINLLVIPEEKKEGVVYKRTERDLLVISTKQKRRNRIH